MLGSTVRMYVAQSNYPVELLCSMYNVHGRVQG